MKTKMKKYQNIECGLHSQYELAIMHQQPIQLRWQDKEGNIYDETLLPIDLIAQQQEEFLLAETQSCEQRKIRLDFIIKHNL